MKKGIRKDKGVYRSVDGVFQSSTGIALLIIGGFAAIGLLGSSSGHSISSLMTTISSFAIFVPCPFFTYTPREHKKSRICIATILAIYWKSLALKYSKSVVYISVRSSPIFFISFYISIL